MCAWEVKPTEGNTWQNNDILSNLFPFQLSSHISCLSKPLFLQIVEPITQERIDSVSLRTVTDSCNKEE